MNYCWLKYRVAFNEAPSTINLLIRLFCKSFASVEFSIFFEAVCMML